MNIETVNELIQSLESVGELSIREQKFLKLAKAFKQLAAENVEMKQIIDSVTNLDNEPQYHDEGMGCGLEDRGITDRYDACRYGWDEAMERIYGEVIPCADELDFSATDRIVAGIKADGVEEFIGRLQQHVDEGDFVGDEVAVIVGAIDCGKEFFEQLREGADK
ncbi:hypothetical protein [Klebsiella pneumoniae]|uniref:hypothetical protein n=1 Tax=Klebsiella pneumoniae TaxID=573 RepID=UPI00165FF538|nr:hypothetical protein [Klebsiella pneumoniae]MBD0014055.1 hypothetical protein [Klebsiella pneumoniae]